MKRGVVNPILNASDEALPLSSGFTDCRLLMVTGHIVESDSISVKVIEHSQTKLITLSVIRLRSSSSASVGPVHAVVSPAAGPPDVTIVDLAPGPEVPLSVLGHQAEEVVLLSAAVDTDGDHVV